MNKLLSQDEVDSLLRGLDTGDIGAVDDFELESKDDLDSFDWATAGLNIRGNMPLLEVVNSRFSQKLRGSLSNSLRKMLDITPDPIETVKYSDFQRSLPVPTSMHLFKMEPLRGLGIIVVESRLVFSLVEAYFGGTGIGATKIEGREFTSIENRIIEKVVHMALNNLVEAWEDVHPIKTEFVRSESNPLVVNVIPGEELLISTKFEIELSKVLGNIIICFPYASYQPIRHKLAGDYRDEEQVTQMDRNWLSFRQSSAVSATSDTERNFHPQIHAYPGARVGNGGWDRCFRNGVAYLDPARLQEALHVVHIQAGNQGEFHGNPVLHTRSQPKNRAKAIGP